jgi:hypothetical protein
LKNKELNDLVEILGKFQWKLNPQPHNNVLQMQFSESHVYDAIETAENLFTQVPALLKVYSSIVTYRQSFVKSQTQKEGEQVVATKVCSVKLFTYTKILGYLENKDFIAFVKVFLILDRLIFSNLFVWFQEMKSKEWKVAKVAEQIVETYGTLCIIKTNYRLFFGEATETLSLTQQPSESQQMEAQGSQSDPTQSRIVNTLIQSKIRIAVHVLQVKIRLLASSSIVFSTITKGQSNSSEHS